MKLTDYEVQIVASVYDQACINFKNRISIADLAAEYKISERTLTSSFKKIYHQTIYHCRLENAMKYAKSLLEKGLQVKSIAIELGYRSTASFIKAFKKIFSHPPGYYIQLGC